MASPLAEELERAARLLVVRSRREATGLFAGNYASAFRGGGLEFEESRPYVPGDDVRSLDWNASARASEPYVKLFREERDQTLRFALDVSASMGASTSPGSGRRSRLATATHALALMATAAGRAGDRTGLVVFDDRLRARVPVARGTAQGWRVTHTALRAAAEGGGTTRLAAGLRALRSGSAARSVVVLLSDFRDPELVPAPPAEPRLAPALADLARRHDLICAVIVDPLDEELPAVGPVRIADPERPGRLRVLDTGSRRVRARYRTAARTWRAALERALRSSGADVLWLRADASPLRTLTRFFHDRAARRARIPR